MPLTIVWRNPLPLVRFTRTLQRIISNELGAVYEVTAPDLTQEFEVIPGEVAWPRMSDSCSRRANAEDSKIFEWAKWSLR
jgi:hypothetical protein